MVEHTQTSRRQQPTNWLSVFDHFVKLALKGLTREEFRNEQALPTCPTTTIGSEYL